LQDHLGHNTIMSLITELHSAIGKCNSVIYNLTEVPLKKQSNQVFGTTNGLGDCRQIELDLSH